MPQSLLLGCHPLVLKLGFSFALLEGFLVQSTQVRRFDHLRVLQLPSQHTCFYKRCKCPHKSEARLDNLLELRQAAELQVWDEGYNAFGDWSVELALQSAGRAVTAAANAKVTAKPKPAAPAPAGGPLGKRKASSGDGAGAAKRARTLSSAPQKPQKPMPQKRRRASDAPGPNSLEVPHAEECDSVAILDDLDTARAQAQLDQDMAILCDLDNAQAHEAQLDQDMAILRDLDNARARA